LKKVLFLFLSLFLLFTSCEQPTIPPVEPTPEETPDPITPENPVVSNDGLFSIINSNVGYNSETTVSLLEPSGGFLSGSFDTVNFFAPIVLQRLETGSNPVISFTFGSALRTDPNEAVFSISELSLGVPTPKADTSSANDNVFYNIDSGQSIPATYSLSDDGTTVNFTFEAGTFKADDKIMAVLGVASQKGELYQIVTSFQPISDVTGPLTIDSDILPAEYYAYAVDTNRIYLLASAEAGNHVAEPTPAESIANVNPAAGSDFGRIINTASKRYRNTDPLTGGADFFHLHDLETASPGHTIGNYPLSHTLADNASSYVYYMEDANGIRTKLPATDYRVSSITDVMTGEETGKRFELMLAAQPIEAGDRLIVVPANSRGEFPSYEASFPLVDTVSPYGTGGNITTSTSTTVTWAGANWSTHTQDMAHEEGELVRFGSFDVTSLTNWVSNESVKMSLTNASLSLTDTTSSGIGAQRIITEDQIRNSYPVPYDAVIMSFASGRFWAVFSGTTLNVYAGFECNVSGSGVNYTSPWEVKGTLTLSITDMSGNPFMYTDNSGAVYNNGIMTVTLQ